MLAKKVDTLHLSWHMTVDPALLVRLEGLRDQAKKGDKEFVTLKLEGPEGPVIFRVMPQGGGRLYRYRLQNERADVLISRVKAENAAQVRIELRAAFLWEVELEGAWQWSRAIANGLGERDKAGKRFGRLPRSVLTRLDMAIDVSGVDFARAIRDDFVMRARKRTRHNGRASAGDACPRCEGSGVCPCCAGAGVLQDGSPLDDVIQLDEHASGLVVSGFSFGHGGMVARVYDKTREVREKSKDKKWLYLCWAQGGWVSTETVWRVEVQIRRETLTELVGRQESRGYDDKALPLAHRLRGTALGAQLALDGVSELASPRARAGLGLDTLEGCRNAMAALWGYAVGGRRGHTAWLKWCVPDPEDARRSRWDARPEWKVVQGVDWMRSEPFEVVRVRVRESRFETLLPQFVGLARAMAAVAGRVRVPVAREVVGADGKVVMSRETGEREPEPGDFQDHVDGYVIRKRKTDGRFDMVQSARPLWWEWVEEGRVDRNLPACGLPSSDEREAALVGASDKRRAKEEKRATAMAT